MYVCTLVIQHIQGWGLRHVVLPVTSIFDLIKVQSLFYSLLSTENIFDFDRTGSIFGFIQKQGVFVTLLGYGDYYGLY